MLKSVEANRVHRTIEKAPIKRRNEGRRARVKYFKEDMLITAEKFCRRSKVKGKEKEMKWWTNAIKEAVKRRKKACQK